jgi:hypothetical protein
MKKFILAMIAMLATSMISVAQSYYYGIAVVVQQLLHMVAMEQIQVLHM